MINGASLSKIKAKILPPDDGQDTATLRTGTVAVVNADGTADITLNGVTVPSVPALGSAMIWVGTAVQLLSYRGALLIIGPAGSGKRIIRKSGDQNLTLNSTTQQNVTEFSFTAKANALYELTLWASYNGNSAQDVAFAWTIPSGADMLRHVLAPSVSVSDITAAPMMPVRRSPGTAQQSGVAGTNNTGFTTYREDTLVIMGGVDGTVQLTAAQAAAGSASPQTVIRGSSLLMIERVG